MWKLSSQNSHFRTNIQMDVTQNNEIERLETRNS